MYICYDVYADNCFIRRVHYFGMLRVLTSNLKEKGHIVKVIERVQA